MGARRYGISLRAFNSIAHEWPQRTREMSSWTREEKIPYLQATVFYFVYNINTIALYLEEKPTSLMNENKWLQNPRITIVQCVGANSSDGKMRWILITKTTMVIKFQFTKFSLIDFVLADRRSLSGKRQIFQLLIFILSRVYVIKKFCT